MPIELRKATGAVSVGAKMMKGDDGGYYIPSVDEEGNLTWTPSEEDMEPIEGANIKGVPGAQGEPGQDTVWVGEEEPTEEYNIWLNPAGEVSDNLATIEYVDGAIATVELMPGPKGEDGKDGEDYVLTEADKTEIAELVLELLPVAEEANV